MPRAYRASARHEGHKSKVDEAIAWRMGVAGREVRQSTPRQVKHESGAVPRVFVQRAPQGKNALVGKRRRPACAPAVYLQELARAARGWCGGDELAESVQKHEAHLERRVRCECGDPRADLAALGGGAQPPRTAERDASGGPFVRLPRRVDGSSHCKTAPTCSSIAFITNPRRSARPSRAISAVRTSRATLPADTSTGALGDSAATKSDATRSSWMVLAEPAACCVKGIGSQTRSRSAAGRRNI
eukprot:scaffold10295_cov116-Isochrysis_galbana.AAC.4